MAKKTQPPPKNFEEALRELEQILGEIERGEVGLEESLDKYERGNFLIQHCMGILNTAEKQIEQVTKAQASGTTDAPRAPADAPQSTSTPHPPLSPPPHPSDH